MKNKVSHLCYLSALLLLCSAFLQPPATAGIPSDGGHTRLFTGSIYVTFAGKYDGEITRQEVEKQTELKVEGCYPGSWICDVTLVLTKTGRAITLATTSGVLTTEMRTQLKSLTKGDGFEFRNIKVALPNGRDVAHAQGGKFVVQ